MPKTTTKNCEEPKGIRNIRTFITADALLAAILLVWAQLRVHPSIDLFVKHYTGEAVANWSDYNFSAAIGLLLTYPSVVLALFALAWAGWRSIEKPADNTPRLAIGLFGASIAMAIINVVQSVCSVIIKFIKEPSVYHPLSQSTFPCWLWVVTGIWVFLAVIAAGLLFAFSPTRKWCKCCICALVGVGMCLGVFFLIYVF